jgi:putative DNA topoisomerase
LGGDIMVSSKDNPFVREKTKAFCPECQSELEIKSGKGGAFWGCSAYPECHYTKPLTSHSDINILKVLDDICCPECEGDLAVKSGKYGMFIGCMNYPSCHFTVKEDDDSDYQPVVCPKCEKGELHMRANKKGHSFYACNEYPKCDYLVNYKPVHTSCKHCNWPIMTEHDHDKLQCPNCHHFEQREHNDN